MRATERFAILQRDRFRCGYCGATPGNELLQVDHIIPQSWNGSDNDENLITACDKCNNGKSDRVALPVQMTTGERDADGWLIWRRWGSWSIKVPQMANDLPVIATDAPGYEYFIELGDIREDWYGHIKDKHWATPEVLASLCDAIDFAEKLIVV
jgi:hypothetical protein